MHGLLIALHGRLLGLHHLLGQLLQRLLPLLCVLFVRVALGLGYLDIFVVHHLR